MTRRDGPRERLRGWSLDPRLRSLAIPLAIFAIALALRVAYLWQASTGPFFLSGGVDSSSYMQRAFDGLGKNWPGPFAFDQPPLYPLWLAFSAAFVGPSPWALKIIQAFVGSSTCVLVYFIAHTIFRDVAIAATAGLLCALHGTLIYYDGQIVSASLETFLLCVALIALLRADHSDRSAWWITAGLAIGMSSINRGAILLSVPFVLYWIYRRQRWNTAQAIRILMISLPIAACVLPVAAHNFRNDVSRSAPKFAHADGSAIHDKGFFERLIDRDFVVITSRVAMNLYLGNDAQTYARNDPNHPFCFAHTNYVMKLPWRATGDATASGQQRYLLDLTRETIAANPLAWLHLTGSKMLQFVNGAEIARNTNLYADRRYSSVLSALLRHEPVAFPGGLLLPFALLGLFLARKHHREQWLLVSFLIPRALFVISFFVAARLRVPILPILAIYAAFALIELSRRWRKRGVVALAAPAMAFLVLVTLSNLPVVATHEEHGAYEHFNHGNHLRRQGAISVAIPHYRKAVKIDPSSPAAHYLLGSALDQHDQPERAKPHLERAIDLDPQFVEASLLLGKIHQRTGRIREAMAQFEYVLEIDPTNTGVKRLLGELRAEADPAEPGGVH